MKNIKVSVVSISYNQEKYIAQALEGFVSQKTDFPFEIIICDDNSTDSTAKIIKDYAKKYPDIIKPVLRIKNLGIQKNLVDGLKRAVGDYVALCEGDDFWTDNTKLQRQADFLDQNSSYNIVFHPVRVFYENHQEKDTTYPESNDEKEFTTKNLLKNNFIQTNSVMYRKVSYENLSLDVMPFDWYLHLVHVNGGKIGFINRVMSAYRRHENGVWWGTHNKQDETWKKHGIGHMVLYAELLKIYGDKDEYRQIIDKHIEGTIDILNRIDETYETSLIQTFADKFSELDGILLQSLSRITYVNYRLLEKLTKTSEDKQTELLNKINDLEREKQTIVNSRAYKVGHKLATLSHIVRRKK